MSRQNRRYQPPEFVGHRECPEFTRQAVGRAGSSAAGPHPVKRLARPAARRAAIETSVRGQ
jgi:hypothetical protein